MQILFVIGGGNGKKNLYLLTSGELKREMNTLVFIKNDTKFYYPIEQIHAIHIYGNLVLNKKLIEFLNQYKISIMFYNYYGQYVGCYLPSIKRKGNILVSQVLKYHSIIERNKIICSFMKTQIHNELSFLYYYKKKGYSLDFIIDDIKQIEKEWNQCIKNKDYPSITMLYEARIKQRYYQCFDIILENTNFSFSKRSIRPPKNECNALISFGYTLLYNEVLTAIIKTPLAPEISFIHSIYKHGNSLQFDIADMIKSVYIDRLVIRLIKRKQIETNHFIITNKGTYLNEEGKKIFLREYEKMMNQTICDKRNNKSYSYRQLILRECYLLIKHITDKEEYKGYRMGW